MIPREILKAVRLIELRTRKVVNDIFSGEYHSVFKGRGMEFSEVREYQIGDDIRTIDWNVTARNNHPYVKIFEEERQLTVILVVDVSGSGSFGSHGKIKREVMSEISGLLALSAIKNDDKVGLINFSSKIDKYVPPKKGRSHVLRVIREVLFHGQSHGRTEINAALEFLMRVARRRSVIFILSDFLDNGYFRNLRVLSNKHDVNLIRIVDPVEMEIPDAGYYKMIDNETGETLWVDTSDAGFREQHREKMSMYSDQLRTFCRKDNIDLIEISATRSYIEPLIAFFKRKAIRAR